MSSAGEDLVVLAGRAAADVARAHAALYPAGCPRLCEACAARLGVALATCPACGRVRVPTVGGELFAHDRVVAREDGFRGTRIPCAAGTRPLLRPHRADAELPDKILAVAKILETSGFRPVRDQQDASDRSHLARGSVQAVVGPRTTLFYERAGGFTVVLATFTTTDCDAVSSYTKEQRP